MVTFHFHTFYCQNLWFQSYGGFLVSQTMALDTDVIQCGIALAPCTNMQLCRE